MAKDSPVRARTRSTGAVEHHGLSQRAQGSLGVDDLAQARRIKVQANALPVQVSSHGKGIWANVLLVLLKIGLGHRQGVVECALERVR